MTSYMFDEFSVMRITNHIEGRLKSYFGYLYAIKMISAGIEKVFADVLT